MGSYPGKVWVVRSSALGAMAAGPVTVPATRQRRHMPTRKTRDAQTRATTMSPPVDNHARTCL